MFKRKLNRFWKPKEEKQRSVSYSEFQEKTITWEIDNVLSFGEDGDDQQRLKLNVWDQHKVMRNSIKGTGYIVPALDLTSNIKYWIKVLPKREIQNLHDALVRNSSTGCSVIPQVFGTGYLAQTRDSCLIIQDYGIPLSKASELTEQEVKSKIDFCKKELEKSGIQFRECDLDPSHILFRPHSGQNEEGIVIINLPSRRTQRRTC